MLHFQTMSDSRNLLTRAPVNHQFVRKSSIQYPRNMASIIALEPYYTPRHSNRRTRPPARTEQRKLKPTDIDTEEEEVNRTIVWYVIVAVSTIGLLYQLNDFSGVYFS